MKSTLQLAFLALFLLAAGCSRYDRELLGDPQPAQPAPAAQSAVTTSQEPPVDATEAAVADDSMGVGMFNDLDYYGQWYQVDPYGWVWRPTVITDWQPFTNGHWIWTQYGWMWVDYDPWGWATSHYGYWVTDFRLGWIWIPDYQWSPVQCDWMVYDDYICWAPVPPPGHHFREPWEGEQAWVSVPVRKFKDNNVAEYRVTPKFKAGESERTMYRGAPDVRDIERTGGKFATVDVTLNRRVVGDHEFAKVIFPPGQQTLIDAHRGTIGSTSSSAPIQYSPSNSWTPPPASGGGDSGGGGSVSTPVHSTGVKSKGSSSGGSNDSGKKQSKFKERNSNNNKDSKSKDESKGGKKKG
ncbi:MAG TPA: DUF6600 domain-containing protein [Candidatus Krumholzibacteria bacterium]|nr:DUF6600 domain-containing protein [Candidatus Krumholzibacteria bacterium]